MIPAPGTHGGDGPAVARALGVDPTSILDLSVNLNPAAMNVALLAGRYLESLRHYPNPSDATRLLAGAIGVDPCRLLLTNGGSEAITLVATEIGGRVRSEPEFALHPRNEAGPVWRSDPHSPSGQLASEQDHADVWDEAFFPLATGIWSAHRAGVTVGSLTKLYACPGLRVGYIVADDVDRFARRQPRWSVNSLALALLPSLLELTDLRSWADSVTNARCALHQVLARWGIPTEPSDAPWVLARAPGLRNKLVRFGVLVRDCTSFGMPDYVRVGVTDDAGLDRLADALARLHDMAQFP